MGLTLDENMNWRTHINKLCSNVARYFSVFFNIRSYTLERLRKTLYYAFTYSRIQYGIEVYGSAAKTIINQLYVTQNKLLKVLFNKHYRYHTDNLYRELKLLKSEDIFNSLLLQFVHRTVRNNCPEPFKDYLKKEKLYMDLTQETKMIRLKIVLRQIMEKEQSITKALPYGINWKVKSGRPLTQFLKRT